MRWFRSSSSRNIFEKIGSAFIVVVGFFIVLFGSTLRQQRTDTHVGDRIQGDGGVAHADVPEAACGACGCGGSCGDCACGGGDGGGDCGDCGSDGDGSDGDSDGDSG